MKSLRFLAALWLLFFAPSPPAHAELKYLSNGVPILLNPSPSSEFTAVAVFVKWRQAKNVKTACLQELAGRALFFGSLNRSFEAASLSVRRVGGSLDVQVTPDFLIISCLTVPERISETANLIGEALKNAEYPEEALARARALIAREAKEREEKPYEALRYALMRRANQTPDWSLQDLTRISPQEVKAYFLEQFARQNIVVSVAGGFDPAKTYRTFDNNLFELKRGFIPLPRLSMMIDIPEDLDAPLPKTLPTLRAAGRDGVAYALLAMPAPPSDDMDFPAFLVFHALLGIGHQSRLLRHFREEQGLGYETGASFYPQFGEPLIAQVQWDANALPQSARPAPEQIAKEIQDEVGRIALQPFSDDELQRARQMAAGRLALAHERALDKAILLGWLKTMGEGQPLGGDMREKILRVTNKSVANIAKSYLHRATLGVMSPQVSRRN